MERFADGVAVAVRRGTLRMMARSVIGESKRVSRVLAGAALTIILHVCAGAAGAQSGTYTSPQRIEGRVRTAMDSSVRNAEVTLTTIAPRELREDTTDADGNFSFVNPGGSGEYILTVVAPGFRPVRRRIANEARQAVLRAEVTLAPMTLSLDPVSITASVATPAKRFFFEIGPGGLESSAEGARAASPLSRNGFADLLATNLFFDREGALGLPPSESATQLNGLRSFSESAPRTLPTAIKAGVSDYDIAVGGFSGGRIAVEISPAGEFASRTGVVSVDRGSGGQTSFIGSRRSVPASVALDVGGSSRHDSVGVSWGLRAQRSTTSNASLTTDTIALRASGLTPEAVETVERLAKQRRAWGDATPNALSAVTSLEGALRLDLTSSRTKTNAVIVTGGGSASEPALSNAFASPSRTLTSRTANATAQSLLRWSDAAHRAWDLRTGVTALQRAVTSAWNGDLASIVVRPRASTSVASEDSPALQLGGAPSRGTERQLAAEVVAEREGAVTPGAMQRKLILGARTAWYVEQNRRTSAVVEFPSIPAFEAANPARISVQPGAAISASTQRLTAGISQTARVSGSLKATAGVRGDYQRLLIGLHRHGGMDFSPRLGLTWNFAAPTEGPGFVSTNLLTRQLVPPGVLRLGAGVFVGELTPDAGARPGGTAGSTSEFFCATTAGDASLGADVSGLTPDRLAAFCRDLGPTGQTGQSVSTTSLHPAFRVPRSYRTTASLVTRWRSMDFSVDGVLSMNDRQQRIMDTAVRAQSVGLVDGERPFFAPLESIDPSDGRIMPRSDNGARSVRRALLLASTQRSISERLVIQASTKNGSTRLPWRIGYALGRVRALEGGWDRDAFESPWRQQWAAGVNDRRHQVQLELGRSAFGVSASMWLRFLSGTPFSPIVDGDVNGDGNARNDRAVVPGGSRLPRGVTADAFQSAMNEMPSYARACLQRQLGSVAERSSCRAPWGAASAFYINVNPGQYFNRRGVDVSILIDGWMPTAPASSAGLIDPVLLRVQGYDPRTSAFVYAINRNFGKQMSPTGSVARGNRVTVAVSVPLAPEIQSQQLDRWLARNGIGSGLSRDSLAARFARNVPNLYAAIATSDDDLGLSGPQRTRLDELQVDLNHALWNAWSDLADGLIASGARRSSVETLAMVQRTTDIAWEISRRSAHTLRAILTPAQESLLPWPARALVRAETPVHFKVIYY